MCAARRAACASRTLRPAPLSGPGRPPAPAPPPSRWAPQVSALPRPRLRPRGSPRAGRAPNPDPARRSGAPRGSPRPPSPAAPGPPAPRSAPRAGAALLPPPSPEKVAILVHCLRPPSPCARDRPFPGQARPAPRLQVTGGWRGQPPVVHPLVGFLCTPWPAPGSRALWPWLWSCCQRRLWSARGAPYLCEGPTSSSLPGPPGGRKPFLLVPDS